MKSTEPVLGKLSNAMIDAIIAIRSRVVTVTRGCGIRNAYSIVNEDSQVSDIKPATVDALIRRNLVVSKLVRAYHPGYGSEERVRLAKGVAEYLPLGVGLL